MNTSDTEWESGSDEEACDAAVADRPFPHPYVDARTSDAAVADQSFTSSRVIMKPKPKVRSAPY